MRRGILNRCDAETQGRLIVRWRCWVWRVGQGRFKIIYRMQYSHTHTHTHTCIEWVRVACFGFCFCHLFRLLFLHHFRTLSTHICKQVRQSLAQLSAMKHTRSPAAFPSPYARIHRHCHTLDTHVHTHVITIANSESQNTRISAHNSQINSVTHNATPPLLPYIPKPCSPPHPAHRSFSTFWVIISALLSITND